MDSQLRPSFIPKQAVAASLPPVQRGGGSNLITVVSFIILIIAALYTAGTYGYKLWLEYEINHSCPDPAGIETRGCGLLATLGVYQRTLNEELISEIERFDTQLNMAKTILGRHETLVPLFDLLSRVTLKTVRYNKFGLEGNVVTLNGVAGGFEDVAVQSDVLNREKDIKEAMFSDVKLDEKGNVNFKLTFSIAPGLLSYSNYVQDLKP